MSQDTRKDKRAKVVSLNVRYKSATVDEFIENHSHDVSKGGIFVKTPTPFPPGTLLKFEIRLAGDKSVISGVGRVVWKREPTSAGADKPAGMGVKFIKIDEASRALIERLTKQEGAGTAYTSEPGAAEEPASKRSQTTLRGIPAAAPVGSVPPASAPSASAPPIKVPAPSAAPAAKPVPSAAVKKAQQATMVGVAPPGAKPPPAPSSKPAPPPPSKPAVAKAPSSSPQKTAAPRPQMPPPRKATMMGMGIPSPSSPPIKAAAPTTPPPGDAQAAGEKPTLAPGAGDAMFPSFDYDSSREPVKEPTVMKQAAELLEEALKEAGGSLEEIGQNPLFLQKGDKEPISVQKIEQSGDTMIMGTAVGQPGGAAATSPALGGTPAPAPAIGGSQPPPAVADSVVPPPAAPARSTTTTTGATKRLSDEIEPRKKKGGGGTVVFLLLVLLGLGAGGVWAFQTGKLAGLGFGPDPTPPPPPSAEPLATPTDTAAAVATTADAAVEESDASAASTGDAAVLAATGDAGASEPATKDAGAATATTAAVTAEAKPVKPAPPPAPVFKPKPKPTATATADEPSDPTPTPTATPTPTPTEAPAPTAKPAPKYEDPYD
jgi:uncharacterized protein (TIGR02266 family)